MLFSYILFSLSHNMYIYIYMSIAIYFYYLLYYFLLNIFNYEPYCSSQNSSSTLNGVKVVILSSEGSTSCAREVTVPIPAILCTYNTIYIPHLRRFISSQGILDKLFSFKQESLHRLQTIIPAARTSCRILYLVSEFCGINHHIQLRYKLVEL